MKFSVQLAELKIRQGLPIRNVEWLSNDPAELVVQLLREYCIVVRPLLTSFDIVGTYRTDRYSRAASCLWTIFPTCYRTMMTGEELLSR